MTVHIIKLCVGVDDVDELAGWQTKRLEALRQAGETPELWHVTRSTPKRAAEVLKGGSLYWVIRRVVQVRQRIVDIRETTRTDGKPACMLVLDPKLVPVAPRPHRPFQGWRYLSEGDAPRDISTGEAQGLESLPKELANELRELGLI